MASKAFAPGHTIFISSPAKMPVSSSLPLNDAMQFSTWIASASKRLSVALNFPKDDFNISAMKQSDIPCWMMTKGIRVRKTRGYADSDSISRDGSWLSITSIGFRGRNKGKGKEDQRISSAKAYFIMDSPNWNRKWSLLSDVIIDHFDPESEGLLWFAVFTIQVNSIQLRSAPLNALVS